MKRPLVAVSQPYVPAYRLPLFSAVQRRLSDVGVDFVVAANEPSGAQAARGDSVNPDWRVDMDAKFIRLGGRSLAVRRFPKTVRPDVVVSELEALNLLAWSSVLRRRKVILWGHGKPYVNDAGLISDRIEWTLARRANAVMTYAEGGRRYLVERGRLRAERVIAIGNSTDSSSLRREYESTSPERLADLRKTWPNARRALFVGGLDASKRIDFLVDAAIAAHALDPAFSLIVVGRGELEGELERAGRVITHIPAARGRALAELAHVCQSIWMPGRIGLVAVDALAVGLPILTTSYRFHAPEVEFLQPDELFRLPDDPAQYAAAALAHSDSRGEGHRPLRQDIPTVESVADKFTDVVTRVLGEN